MRALTLENTPGPGGILDPGQGGYHDTSPGTDTSEPELTMARTPGMTESPGPPTPLIR